MGTDLDHGLPGRRGIHSAAQHPLRGGKGLKAKLASAGAVLAVILVGIAFLRNGGTVRPEGDARKEWKENAIVEIDRRALDTNWLSSEIEMLRKRTRQDPSDSSAWFSEHLILLTNGEWIVYSSMCSKEDSRIQDIFLGRSSDTKWHYSTFHFCVRMLDLRMEDPSESLAKFREKYSLREFDGHSDECLNKTWPPPRH